MSRISLTSVAAGLSALAFILDPQVSCAQELPSIVLIVTDDQRWDTLTTMATVNNELLQKGVQFSNSFVATPLCAPGRAAILTGQYPHHNDVWRNGPPHGGFDSFVDTQSLAVWLQGAGYTTSLIGKYINGYPVEGTYVPPGWSHWVAFAGDVGYYSYSLNRNGIVEYHGSQAVDYSTDVLRDEATAFIRNTVGPIFLEFTPKAPHGPPTPADRHKNTFMDLPPFRPPSYNEADVSDKPTWLQEIPLLTPSETAALDEFRRNQLRTLLAVDEALASILTALSDTGRLSNTMIIFTSDNGFLWGEHRWRSKGVPYEEAIRVPLVIRYDPYTPVPRQLNQAVLNIDIAPTLLDLAETAPPPDFTFDGLSMMPFLRGENPTWRTDFIVEILHEDPVTVPTYCSVRSAPAGRAKVADDIYTRYDSSGEEEFYDRGKDLYQVLNGVIDKPYERRVAELRELWTDLCPPPPQP